MTDPPVIHVHDPRTLSVPAPYPPPVPPYATLPLPAPGTSTSADQSTAMHGVAPRWWWILTATCAVLATGGVLLIAVLALARRA